ncbi:MAG: B12-binding domain-containing radical SAM protein [Bacillota bacterium]
MVDADILLVAPPSENQGGENLGLASLAANLRRHGFRTDILDASLLNLGERETLARILQSSASIVGFQVFQDLSSAASRLVRALKAHRPGLPVLMGGYFPTLATSYSMSLIPADLAVLGEADLSILDVMQAIRESGKVPHSVPGTARQYEGDLRILQGRPLVQDLDTLPFPARDYLPMQLKYRPTASMVTSRGCYGNCTFCSMRAFYGHSGWRARSPENVLEEIRILKRDYAVEMFNFLDDNFVGSALEGPQRARDIAELLIKSHLGIHFSLQCRADDVERNLFELLKQAGLSRVAIGVETFDAAMLSRFGKGIKPDSNRQALRILEEIGIPVTVSIILTDPYITFEELRASYLQLEKECCKCYLDVTNAVIPWMGTTAHERAKADGLLVENVESPTILYRDQQTARAIERIRRGLASYREARTLIKGILTAIRQLPIAGDAAALPAQDYMHRLGDAAERCEEARKAVYRASLCLEPASDMQEVPRIFSSVLQDLATLCKSLGVPVGFSEPMVGHDACSAPPSSPKNLPF